MKVLDKYKIMENNLQKYAETEKNVLLEINNPFIVSLHCAF